MTRADRSFIIATPRNNNARLTPPAASSAASSNSDRDSQPCCPGQRETGTAFSLVSRIPPFRAGIFKAWGSFDPMEFGESARGIPALHHRLDEPARLSLGMVASLQSPLPFRLASISTRNNSVTRLGCFGGLATTQANWMISFLSPNQGIGVG